MAGEGPVILTEKGKAGLESELEQLQRQKVPSVQRRILELSSDGDVSDNSEYEETKEQLIHLEVRIREIQNLLRRAKVVERSDEIDVVGFGSTVTIVDDLGESETWTLVSPEEANSMRGTISVKSPVGAALMGKHVGESVAVQAPGGETTFTVEKVE